MADIREVLDCDLETLASGPLEPMEVAVLDSGIDATHPDLLGRVSAAFSASMVNDVAQIADAPVGINHDAFGHGTAVGSIIAGLAPNTKLVDIRILDPANQSTGAMFLAGFRSALERRCRIINLSLAATARFAQPLAELCELAHRQGQVVVAAKRNLGVPDLGFPAELALTVSVDRQRVASPFKLQFLGGPIEFGAHGDEVVCAAAGGGYTTMTGTSFATPTVSGLCALLLGRYPDLTLFELKTALKAVAGKGV